LSQVSLQTKHMKRFIIFFLVCLALMRVPFITGCANIVPPSGGPKDTLPPVLIEADPEMRALNVPVNTNKIVLSFDEYIDLKDISKNLIASPVPKQMPFVHSHLKVITVTIKDTLQPNTTYALNFGKAVTDVNEGNVLKNFTYVFSTGKYVDSLQYSGRVIMSNTGKPDSSLIVMLHSQLFDSAVAKFRPRYITRLDSAGNFTFKNIRPDIYALYALEDQSGMHMYTSKSQVFAFADSPVDLRVSTAPLLLYAYADTSDLKHPKKTVAQVSTKKEDKDKVKRLIITGNIPNGLLALHHDLELSFALPIRDFDSTGVRLTNDSFQDFKQIQFEFDSTSKKLTIIHPWKEDTRYYLILQKDFADDTLGEKLLKIDTIRFKTKAESDYGNLRLRFKNLDLSRHPVLLFIQGEKILLSSAIGRSFRYNNKLFEPGDYDLRILYDTNQNGIWDPGDFYKHLQPEIVVPIRKKLSVRANWDNEVDITL
jgi:hypothetical protein